MPLTPLSEDILIFRAGKNSSNMVPSVLGEAGWNAIVVENGIDGLRKLCAHEPSLVIIDVATESQGQALCQCIKRVSNVPVIMLSARGRAEDAVQSLELGADDYMVKPVPAAVLVARVRACLRRMNWPRSCYMPDRA